MAEDLKPGWYRITWLGNQETWHPTFGRWRPRTTKTKFMGGALLKGLANNPSDWRLKSAPAPRRQPTGRELTDVPHKASPIPEAVPAGGLMSYSPNFPEMFRHAAVYVDKILRGANPLKTAKALGLTIPPSVLVRADEVIQ